MGALSEYKSDSNLDRLRGDAPAGEGGGGFFDASDGVKLFYQHWLPESPSENIIVCLHGMAAHGHYYSLAADHFFPLGLSLYAPDLRGHGLSGGRKGNIESGERFLDDIHEFISFVKSGNPRARIFVLGESLGGLLAIVYAARHPDSADGIIALAPALKTAYVPGVREILLAPYYAAGLLACPHSRIFIMAGREHRGIENPLHLEYHLNDPLVNRLIAPNAIIELRKLMHYGNREAPAGITIPILVMQGEKDTAVDHRNTKRFFRKIVSADKTLKTYPRGGHNLLSDPRSPGILNFISAWIENL